MAAGLSARQAHLLALHARPEWRLVSVSGPAGSGKTWAAVRGSLDRWSLHYRGCAFLVGSKTRDLLEHTVMAEARDWAAERGTTIRKTDNGWTVPSALGGVNHLVPLVYAEGDVAVERIRGLSLGGAYLDEATSMRPRLLSMLHTRMRVGDCPQMVATMNPQSPTHWWKRLVLDRRRPEWPWIRFGIDDNPSLDPAVKAEMAEALTGVEYQRLFLGLWVPNAGLVYAEIFLPGRLSEPPEGTRMVRTVAAADHADSGITHALLGRLDTEGRWWITHEWRWDDHGKDQGLRSAAWKAARLVEWAAAHGHRRNALWIVDPHAKGLTAALREAGAPHVEDGWDDIRNGAQAVKHALSAGRLHVAPACVHLVNELGELSWDERAAEHGDDVPTDVDDHGADALRYLVATTNVLRRSGKWLDRDPVAKRSAQLLEPELRRSRLTGRPLRVGRLA